VFECVLVPYAVGIEYEDLLGLHVAEDHVLVEHIHRPQHLTRHDVRINLLQVLYVHYDSSYISEEISFMEDNLFGVREKFSMESEIVQKCHLAGKGNGCNEEGHKNHLRDASDPGASAEEEHVVHEALAEKCVGLVRFVQEDTVLASSDATRKAILMRALMVAVIVKDCLEDLEEHLVLEEVEVLEPVIGSVLVGLVVAQNIIAVDTPSSGDPLMEFLIHDTLFGKLIINVVLSRNLKLCVLALALIIMMLLMTVTVPTTTSDRGIGKGLKF
jgi:hypothetical protein